MNPSAPSPDADASADAPLPSSMSSTIACVVGPDKPDGPDAHWPAPPGGRPFPFPSPLDGARDSLWDALAHVDPQLFEQKRQQLAIREGLEKIGLGWAGTNTSWIRRYVVSPLFKEAETLYKNNKWARPDDPLPELKRLYNEETDDVQWTPHDASALVVDGRAYTDGDGYLEFDILGLDEGGSFPAAVMERINTSIDRTGMAVIRSAVSKPMIRESGRDGPIKAFVAGEALVREAEVGENKTRSSSEIVHTRWILNDKDRVRGRQYLQRSAGSGEAGEAIHRNGREERGSFYVNVVSSKYLDRLQGAIVRSLRRGTSEEGDTDETVANERKALLLKYSKGGENYSHRDANTDGYFDCQALLMLSSKDEYGGGRFYVVTKVPRANGGSRIVRTLCPQLDAGDLVIFRADNRGDFDHGMTAVTSGERVAIGLLQTGLQRKEDVQKTEEEGAEKVGSGRRMRKCKRPR